MAPGIEDTSTELTSSEDEGCSKRKRKCEAQYMTVNIGGSNNNVSVGQGSQVTSTTALPSTATELPDINPPAETASVDAGLQQSLKNPNELFEKLSQSRGPEKDKVENFILQDILPQIKEYAIKRASSYNDSLELLARFCSPDLESPRVVKQSLKTLKRLLELELGRCESANALIIKVEVILRQPLVDGTLNQEPIHLQRSRLEVYCSVLSLVLLCHASGGLSYPYNKTQKQEIEQFVAKNIEKSLQRTSRIKKDRWRFSMETVLNLIKRLSDHKKTRYMHVLIGTCREIMQEGDLDSARGRVDSLVEKLQRTEGGSVDLYLIMRMLHGKMCDNAIAYHIVECIIKKHNLFSKQWQKRNENWHFALLACQILLHAINNPQLPKATRIQAARCLAYLQETEVFRKSPVIYQIIEGYCIKSSFARDMESRKIILEKRFHKQLLDIHPVGTAVTLNHICKIYESKGLERVKLIYKDDYRIIERGLYDHKPVAITAVIVNPMKQLYSADQDLLPAEKGLRTEVEILQHLNQTSNEHVPMIFAADTKKQPYHMICEYIPNEDLLHFLEVCKEEELPTYRRLFEICLGIVDCMIFIHEKNVIHNQLRPEHVLLDQNLNVRITGFGRAKLLSEIKMRNGDGVHGKKLSLEDPSIRYAAPECLTDNPLFSSKSDVWAFGVVMYVVFTCGRIPFANQDVAKVREDILSGQALPKELYMRDEVFSLIQKCLGQERKDRISFQELKKLLAECIKNADDGERVKISAPVTVEIDQELYDDLPLGVSLQSSSVTNVEPSVQETIQDFRPVNPIKTRCTPQKRTLVDNSKIHLEKLKSLDHPNLAKIAKDKKTNFGRYITYKDCKGQNLRDYILHNKDCTEEQVTRFSVQIAEAINYLHINDIVLCTLNAESIMVVDNNHVQIFGLHVSRSLLPSNSEINALSCGVRGQVHPDMYRWCAKEVIQDGVFSKPSDIWALAMTIWEMFSCLEHKDENANPCLPTDEKAKPFFQYSNEQILAAIKRGCRPDQPVLCPDWVYVLITQCWCLYESERASSLTVLDCFTHEHPWESFILQRWIEKHEIHENWPNLNVVQLSDGRRTFSRQEVEESVSEECVGYHDYEYEQPSWFRKKFRTFINKATKKPSSMSQPRLPLPPPTRPLPPPSSSVSSASSCSFLHQPLPVLSDFSLSSSPSLPSLTSSISRSSALLCMSSSSFSAESESVSSRCSTLSSWPTSLSRRCSEFNENKDKDLYEIPWIVSENAGFTMSSCGENEQRISNEGPGYVNCCSENKDDDDDDDDDDNDDDDSYGNACDKFKEETFVSSTRARSSTISLPLRLTRPLPPKPMDEILTPVPNVEINFEVVKKDDLGIYDDIYYRSRELLNQVPRSSRLKSASLPARLSVLNRPQVVPADVCYVDTNQNYPETPAPSPYESYQDLRCSLESGYIPLVRQRSRDHEVTNNNCAPYDDTVSDRDLMMDAGSDVLGENSEAEHPNSVPLFYMNI